MLTSYTIDTSHLTTFHCYYDMRRAELRLRKSWVEIEFDAVAVVVCNSYSTYYIAIDQIEHARLIFALTYMRVTVEVFQELTIDMARIETLKGP